MSAIENGGEGRVAVVTGASSGIGKAAAKALAAMKWQVIGLGRDPARSRAALTDIRQHAPGARIEMVVADLAIMSEVLRAAREIAALTDKVDALLNNAGGIGKKKAVTVEGNEAIFAGNHLGPFLLTRELLPLLRAAVTRSTAGQARVVNVSSSASDLSGGSIGTICRCSRSITRAQPIATSSLRTSCSPVRSRSDCKLSRS